LLIIIINIIIITINVININDNINIIIIVIIIITGHQEVGVCFDVLLCFHITVVTKKYQLPIASE